LMCVVLTLAVTVGITVYALITKRLQYIYRYNNSLMQLF
jgi:hypothetical protein